MAYKILREITEKYDLKLNIKKTKYMANKGIEELEKIKIERVNQFKYVEIILYRKGSLIAHYKLMKQKIMLNTKKL